MNARRSKSRGIVCSSWGAVSSLDLRHGKSRLAVELLKLLGVHPRMARTDLPEQGQNLGVAKRRRGFAQHEAAAIVVDEGDAASAARIHHRTAIADHLEPERGTATALLEIRSEVVRLER